MGLLSSQPARSVGLVTALIIIALSGLGVRTAQHAEDVVTSRLKGLGLTVPGKDMLKSSEAVAVLGSTANQPLVDPSVLPAYVTYFVDPITKFSSGGKSYRELNQAIQQAKLAGTPRKQIDQLRDQREAALAGQSARTVLLDLSDRAVLAGEVERASWFGVAGGVLVAIISALSAGRRRA